MFEAYKYYWENAFKYRATSTRADFWWPVLVNFIIFVILYFLLAIAGFASVTSIMNGYNRGVGFFNFLALRYCSIRYCYYYSRNCYLCPAGS